MHDLLRLGKLLRVIVRRGSAWDGQGRPLAIERHFTQEHDLPDMIGVVRQLAIDRFRDRMALVANVDRCLPRIRSQRVQRSEQALPALIPLSEQFRAGVNTGVELGLGLLVQRGC